MIKPIYLDNAATTQVNPEVISEITNAMKEDWYNPSSIYYGGRIVKDKIESARSLVAKSIKAKSDEVYFTSSGSEANNWAIQGFVNHETFPVIITSNIEHKSILECVSSINTQTWCVDVDKNGMFDLNDLREKILRIYRAFNSDKISLLVSLQFANNEIGVIQDIKKISELVHSYDRHFKKVVFHTDAVQAYPHIRINVNDLGIDMMSVSGHKIGCPKGIGFLYIKRSVKISPLIYGAQENGMRGGTENAPYILGLSKAVSNLEYRDYTDMRYYFENKLKELGCTINCENSDRLENITSCMLPDKILGELFLLFCNQDGLYLSAGSACNSRSNKKSLTLQSIGLNNDEIDRTVRFSLPLDISYKTLDVAIDIIKGALEKLNENN